MSTTYDAVPPLLVRLLDDAAMFPPGNAEPEQAISEHLRYRRSWFAPVIGPLLVPAARWRDFCNAHAESGRPALAVVLIGTSEPPRTVPEGIRVIGFELRVTAPPIPAVPAAMTLAVEMGAPPAGTATLEAVRAGREAGTSVVAKLRTGGTTADAFPDESTLAAFVVETVTLGVPFKLTAGLHHAIRHTDPRTGFEHHGFLNVLAATARAAEAAGRVEVADALAERDPGLVVAEVEDRVAAEIRQHFTSFGCCGVEDPIHDLVDLGLLADAHSDHAEAI